MLAPPFSHYLFDAEQSRQIDRRTIEEMDISGFTLMEVAGFSAARDILRETGLRRQDGSRHGLYLLGKGNNAGDALVVARYLAQHGYQATLVFLSGTEGLSDDTQKNFRLLQRFAPEGALTAVRGWEEFPPDRAYDFIVDGMLGTGLSSGLRGGYAEAVAWANETASMPVFSMDIPTGLHADTGEAMGEAIEAEKTYAFGGRKLGYYLQQGPELAGEIIYCELPFPNAFKTGPSAYLLDEYWVPEFMPTQGTHKYASGVLHVIAGSPGLTGAAIMAAKSAWAEGLGAVILICPRELLSVYEHHLPFVIKRPVGASGDDHFKEEHLQEVLDITREKEGIVLVGPGLGREESTTRFVSGFLAESNSDTVVDADGLWALSQQPGWSKPEEANWILTPHPVELARLIGHQLPTGAERLAAVKEFSATRGVTLLSKGRPGIVGTPEGRCYLTGYDTRYFARAGTGDVLAGKVSAFLASGQHPALSCAQGLLRGKEKLRLYHQNNFGAPEPSELI